MIIFKRGQNVRPHVQHLGEAAVEVRVSDSKVKVSDLKVEDGSIGGLSSNDHLNQALLILI